MDGRRRWFVTPVAAMCPNTLVTGKRDLRNGARLRRRLNELPTAESQGRPVVIDGHLTYSVEARGALRTTISDWSFRFSLSKTLGMPSG